ncbi:unnamed protein product [Caretta caretta]
MSVAILGLGIAALQGCGQGPSYGHTEAVKVLIKEHMATQNKTALAVLALEAWDQWSAVYSRHIVSLPPTPTLACPLCWEFLEASQTELHPQEGYPTSSCSLNQHKPSAQQPGATVRFVYKMQP